MKARITNGGRKGTVDMAAPADQRARWHRYWDKKARSYDREMRLWDRMLFRDSRNWACTQATGQVLEVAVGTGLNLGGSPAGAAVTGIDLSEAMLDLARTRAAQLGCNPTLLQGDAQSLPFDDASFDTA